MNLNLLGKTEVLKSFYLFLIHKHGIDMIQYHNYYKTTTFYTFYSLSALLPKRVDTLLQGAV